MNTPAHLIFGAAVFGRPGRPLVTVLAMAGGFAPDASLYAMFVWCRYVLDVPARTIFREYYYSDAWMRVFSVDNSFVVWGVAFALARAAHSAVWTAFTGAALLHLAFDFPLHNYDARPMFWPLTGARFVSPVSYWDNAYYAQIVGPIEVAISLVLVAYLLVRFRTWLLRGAFALLGVAEVATSSVWRWLF